MVNALTYVKRRDTKRSAALYVRMSTSPQDYSIQHQLEVLNKYATDHGFEVVMVYADAGKSGLRLSGREGLQELIGNVQSGAPGFEIVLVYDISRWGRFQDVDESAHYEFVCRQAGVEVIYCAEHFTGDRSPMSALMKGIKRIMAAEYSRELGDKVHLAQCRFSRMGFKQGGRAGFGLLRVPVSQSGEAKAPLKFGERKGISTDRVRLTTGNPCEVEVVKRIFQLYTEAGLTDTQIATILRDESIPTNTGVLWNASCVRRILINPRYCGQIVYNQTSRRLKGKVLPNPENTWIRCMDALPPMVDTDTFARAQEIRRRRAAGPDREVVLEQIREVFKQHGTINAKICNASPLPKKNTMYRMFGTYMNAFALAGLPTEYTAKGALGLRSTRILIDALIDQVHEAVQRAGGSVERTSVWSVLRINRSVLLKLSIASCRRCEDRCRRWRIPLTCGAHADFVICGLLDSANQQLETYLLLSTASIGKASLLLSRKKLGRYTENSFSSLDQIFGVE